MIFWLGQYVYMIVNSAFLDISFEAHTLHMQEPTPALYQPNHVVILELTTWITSRN